MAQLRYLWMLKEQVMFRWMNIFKRSSNGRVKIDIEIMTHIKDDLDDRVMSQQAIAKKYRVSQSSVSLIANNKHFLQRS